MSDSAVDSSFAVVLTGESSVSGGNRVNAMHARHAIGSTATKKVARFVTCEVETHNFVKESARITKYCSKLAVASALPDKHDKLLPNGRWLSS